MSIDFNKIFTIYGRKSVLEALEDSSLKIFKLHLSNSNRDSKILQKIIHIAKGRDISIEYHNKRELSFISKNSRQDQGVALDIFLEFSTDEDDFIQTYSNYKVFALDSIHNPQNLGMIIRSAVAGDIDAIILPTKNSAQISPLVIKASVGTLFKLPIIKTNSLYRSLKKFKSSGAIIYTLSSHAKYSYKDIKYSSKSIFVLGNESIGVSKEIENLSNKSISIPMNRGVESLNVAITASLLAFLSM